MDKKIVSNTSREPLRQPMLQRCTARLTPAGGKEWMLDMLSSIRKRLPAHKGTSASQLQALLEDEFPLFHPSKLAAEVEGVQTVREVLQQFPQWFRIEAQEGSNEWSVWPVAATTTTTTTNNNNTNSDDSNNTTSVMERIQADYQKILHYCEKMARKREGMYIPLESVMLNSDARETGVVDYILDSKKGELDLKLTWQVRPKRLPRAAVLFIDGDQLPLSAVETMCAQLNVRLQDSSVCVARHASTPPLTSTDLVAHHTPTTYLIEKKSSELRLLQPDLLRDVIYMCSSHKFRDYAESIATANIFKDADVYVCSPRKIRLISAKTVVPF